MEWYVWEQCLDNVTVSDGHEFFFCCLAFTSDTGERGLETTEEEQWGGHWSATPAGPERRGGIGEDVTETEETGQTKTGVTGWGFIVFFRGKKGGGEACLS